MYKCRSNQSGDLSEALVKAYLIKKGWVVLTPSSRDTVYDFIVDRGDYEEKIQVKTLSNGTCLDKAINRSHEVVSKN